MNAGARPQSLLVDVGDGLALHATRSGDGPALVLLHGFTGSGATWSPLVGALAGLTTITVDLPGHGRSSVPASAARYALSRFADDLATLLRELDIPRAMVLGYSLGGRAALHFALAHPGQVAGLLLESTSPGLADDAERAARAASDAALADDVERDGVAAFVDRWERLPLWESQSALPAATRDALRAQRLTNDALGLANSLRGAGAGASPSLLHRLASVSAPTLVVAGSLDARYVAYAAQLAATLPNARVLTVEGAGHAVHLERPDAFAAAVREFVDACATSGALLVD